MAYKNGRYPLSKFIHRGGNIYLTPSLNARWNEAVKIAQEKYGVRLWITGDNDGLGGWNGYRPYEAQVAYKRYYGNKAAAPGFSSHGGQYSGQEVFALDVANWNDLAPNDSLAWARFVAIMKSVGLRTNFVSPVERWHVGDFNNAWVAPDFGPKDKEITVTPYFRDDAKSRSKNGLDLSPNEGTWLNTLANSPQSQATNIVGGIGQYVFTQHVYAQGTPGDVVDLQLAWDDTKTSGPHSMHFVERIEIGADGTARRNVPFSRGVAKSYAVYARLTAPKTNKGVVKVTRFASDALLIA